MPRIRANHIEIYYERAGEGSPLLFISGSGGDLRNKPNQFDSPMADAFELVCYDQRGLGQSDKPDSHYSMADYADDAAGLLDALGIDQVPVVGVSFGGMVAQELALRHGDRVTAMVLACTSSGGAGGASFPLHELEPLPPQERVEAHLKVSDLRHTEQWIAQNPEAWRKRVARGMGAIRPDRDNKGAMCQLTARKNHDTYARLGHLGMPVLLAGGEFDGIAPVENMQRLHERIAHSTLRLFNGGHMFLIQDREAYPYIIQWLRLGI